MADVDIKKLAEQLDAVLEIIKNIRVTTGCADFNSNPLNSNKRIINALQTAERAYGERKFRINIFGTDEIFGEPAWDILLDLFIRQTKEEEISVKSACFKINAPASTTIRWLQVLERNDLICNEVDANDVSRHLIRLTTTGYDLMLRYLDVAGR